ncbi:MAG: NAD(P)H-dependent oxidoreductase [Bacteroidetes bacterium]|nr:NAD(P)H-dependent oxidoreductase [Bacteroidota bacterium]
MPHIAIISSSIRINRQSHRVALFFKKFLEDHQLASSEILDLAVYRFPLFEERLQYQKNPTPDVLDFASKVKSADAIIIVTPEYNGGYPASLKNVVDLLYSEWRRKPIGIAAVSDGPFGGTQVVTSLQFSLWKIGALTVPARFHVASVHENYDENGIPKNKELTEKMANGFVGEIIRMIPVR